MTNFMTLRKMVLAAICLLSSGVDYAAGQTDGTYVIVRDSINAGLRSTGLAGFVISRSSFGEVAAGPVSNGCYRLTSGFGAGIGPTPLALNLLSVKSRKMHAAIAYDHPIDHQQTLCGEVSVEPRLIGSGHTLVFHFDSAITSIGTVTALDAAMNPAAAASAAISGGDVVVTLTDVADNKRLTLFMDGLNGSGKATTSIGFLVGDVTGSRSVTAADISAVKANEFNAVNVNTYKFDLNTDGSILSIDLILAKSRAGRAIP